MTGLVDWPLAERTAAAVIDGLGPLRGGARAGGYSSAEVEAACLDGLERATAYAGLGAVASPPAPELIDRREWSRIALDTLAGAAGPLERSIAADLGLPAPLAPIARRVAGAALGAEAGVAVGYAARRVLGQYDIALFGAERPGRLLFVAENLGSARHELDADPDLFLRWVALHETTHVIQFERVWWLRRHLRELVNGLVAGAAAGIDVGGLAALGRRVLRDPRQLARAALRGELARALADPPQRAILDRLQATMSVIEGHAEHVMDAATPELGSGIFELRRRLDERRARRGGLRDVIGRLLGIDLKLRQYRLGKAFCDAVVETGGAETLRLAWESPAHLPDLAELERPQLWLGRVTEPSRQPA